MSIPRHPPHTPGAPARKMSTAAKVGVGCGGCAVLALIGLVGLILLGMLVSTPEGSAAEPSPVEEVVPELVGLSLPEAEELLEEADLDLGEPELVASGDEVEWTRSAMVVCAQDVADDTAVLGLAPEGVDCPEEDTDPQEWPALPSSEGQDLSDARERFESLGLTVVVESAFGDVDAPATDAADLSVCAQRPDEGEETAPFDDGLEVELFVVSSGQECPARIGDPSPEPEPEPEPTPESVPEPAPVPESTPESVPAPAPAPDPEPAPEPAPVEGVHPGSFCSQHWQFGRTNNGTLMQCTTTAEDSRFRWRSA
ncbi:serine/threonine kinase [Nocardiopsis alba]|uniref:Serine/threonine kinase n=1 Tax=Nocardiopsis alba TaxID=53437 RepID=A0ABV5DQZ2_9ACTN